MLAWHVQIHSIHLLHKLSDQTDTRSPKYKLEKTCSSRRYLYSRKEPWQRINNTSKAALGTRPQAAVMAARKAATRYTSRMAAHAALRARPMSTIVAARMAATRDTSRVAAHAALRARPMGTIMAAGMAAARNTRRVAAHAAL